MNIEKSIEILKEFRNYNKFYKEENRNLTITITLEAKESIDKAIERLLTAYEKEKEKNKKAKEFIQENSHEFNCKRDDLIELEFDNNTNATDLIDILDGNWQGGIKQC